MVRDVRGGLRGSVKERERSGEGRMVLEGKDRE